MLNAEFFFLTWMMAGAMALGYALCLPQARAPAAQVQRRWRTFRAAKTDSRLPRLTLLIPALDEPTVIAFRIEQALSLDYPQRKLQVVAALEGCDDRVEAAVRAFASRGVRVIDSIDAGRDALSGDVVLVYDDDRALDRQALLEWLALRDSGRRALDTAAGAAYSSSQ